jgi:DNA repair exonuclease SbcCD ATPase subunit
MEASRTVKGKRSVTPGKQATSPTLQAFASDYLVLQNQILEIDPSLTKVEFDFRTPLSALASSLNLNKQLCNKLFHFHSNTSTLPRSLKHDLDDLQAELKLKDDELRETQSDLAEMSDRLREATQELRQHQSQGQETRIRRESPRKVQALSKGLTLKSGALSSSPFKRDRGSVGLDNAKYRELVDSGMILENFNGEVTACIDAQSQTIENYLRRLKEAESRAHELSGQSPPRSRSALGGSLRSSSADLVEQVALYKEQVKVLSSQLRPLTACSHTTPRRKARLEEVNELFATHEVELGADKWRDADYLELDGESYARNLDCLREVVLLRDSQLIELGLQLKDGRILLEKFYADLQEKEGKLARLEKSQGQSMKQNVNAEYEAAALHARVDYLTETLEARETTIKDLLGDFSSLQQLKAKLEAKVRILTSELKVLQGATETDRIRELVGVVMRRDDEIKRLKGRVEATEQGETGDYEVERLRKECQYLRDSANEKELAIEELQRKVDAIKPIQITKYAGDKRQSDPAEAQTKTDQLERQLKESEVKLKATQSSLETKKAETGSLQAELTTLRMELKQAKESRLVGPEYSEASSVQSPHFKVLSSEKFQEPSEMSVETSQELATLKAALEMSQAKCRKLEEQLKETQGGSSLAAERGSAKDSSQSTTGLDELRAHYRMTLPRQLTAVSAVKTGDSVKDGSKEAPSMTGSSQHEEPAVIRRQEASLSQFEVEDLQRELKQYKEKVRPRQLRDKDNEVAELFDSVERLTRRLRDTDEKEDLDVLKAELDEQYSRLDEKDQEIFENYVRKDWMEELLAAIEPGGVDLVTDLGQTDYYSRIQRAIARVRTSEEVSLHLSSIKRDKEDTPKVHTELSTTKRESARLEVLASSLSQTLESREKAVKDLEAKLKLTDNDVVKLQELLYLAFQAAVFEYVAVTGDSRTTLRALSADLSRFTPHIRKTMSKVQPVSSESVSSARAAEVFKDKLAK